MSNSNRSVQSSLSLLNKQINLEELLIQTLVAYSLYRAKDPISEVMEDFFKIESHAALVVSQILSTKDQPFKLEGVLASILTLVPLEGAQSFFHSKQKSITHKYSSKVKKTP